MSFSSISSLSRDGGGREQTSRCNARPDARESSSGWPRGMCRTGPLPAGAQRYPNLGGISQDREAVTATG